MRSRPAALLALLTVGAIAIAACGGGDSLAVSTATGSAGAIPSAGSTAAAGASLHDWPMFGLDPQHSSATDASTSITASNVGRLRRRTVQLAGTIDSAPIYLHGVRVGGAAHNVLIATSSYGRTFAIDASSGSVLWTFTPPGYSNAAGSDQVTTASPAADPGRTAVYTSSPDGLIHKLSISDGHELGGWPVSITRLPSREKISSALTVAGPYVVAATGGYFGDAPPYQGHAVLIARSSGRVASVFNTLCSNRRSIIVPSSCGASASAIWAREGAVVEPGGRRLLVATGNGPYNGRTNFGDSVLELNLPGLGLRQSYTPPNQAQLEASDTDLGSSAPALLGPRLAAIAGKDGVLRLLRLDHLGGGQVQTLSTPGGAPLFSAPAVWRHAGHVTLFIADGAGTEAYSLRAGRLHPVWRNNTPGNSPAVAGGLLYVYDPSDGGVQVYRPGSPRPIADLRSGSGHWNSAIVADGHVAVGEGNYMDHSEHGVLDIWSLG